MADNLPIKDSNALSQTQDCSPENLAKCFDFDKDGNLPLHASLIRPYEELNTDSNPKIIEIFDSNPVAARCVNNKKQIPLELACEWNHSMDVIKKIHESFTDCLGPHRKIDPLNILLNNNKKINIEEKINYFIDVYKNENINFCFITERGDDSFLHKALSIGYTDTIITNILNADTTQIKLRNYENYFPMHIALKQKCSEKIIELLFKCWPGIVVKPNAGKTGHNDNPGQFPLHLALKNGYSIEIIKLLSINTDDDNSYYPYSNFLYTYYQTNNVPLLQFALTCDSNYNESDFNDIIEYFVNKYEDSLKTIDENGNLPIHTLAMLNTKKDKKKLFTLFADEYPDSIHVKNNERKKPYDLLMSEEDKQKYKSIIGTEYGSMAKRFFDRRTANVAPTKLGVGGKRKTKRRHHRRN
jgi:hypothetical protein